MDREKPHIVLLSYYFPPSEAIGGARPFRFYKFLKRMGYGCEVITACEQPPGGNPDVTFIPDRLGRVWDGRTTGSLGLGGQCERLVRKCIVPGATGLVWAAHAARCFLEMARRRPGQDTILLTTQPPIGAICAGLLAVLWGRVGWIADFRDPLSFGGTIETLAGLSRLVLRALEWLVHRHAAAIVANTEAAAEVWRAHFPWAARRIHVIWNGYDAENRPLAEPLAEPLLRVIVHAGELYEGRNPNAVVESLARLRARGEPGAMTARVLLVGTVGALAGIDWDLLNGAIRDGWLEVRQPVPRPEAQRLVARAGGLLLVQPQTGVQVPAKLFEYISIGRPILALVPRGSSVEYVLANSGVPFRCVHPEDTAAEADRAVMEFLALPSDPVPFSCWFEESFDARRQTGELAAIIQSVPSRAFL